jgi:general secretion pathway protein N
MRSRHYIITGIIAYFVFLVATIPAAPVINIFEDRIPVTISNVSGTLWSGRAGAVTTDKNLTLKNVEWSFLPWHLLMASIAVSVNAEFNGNPVDARLSTGISGNLSVDDLNMKLDAADVTSLVSLPLGELSGIFQLRIDNAYIEQGLVPRVNGTLSWNQASVTIAESADLGNVSVLINENDESPLSASISNKGGDLALKGTFTTSAQGDYSLKLSMKPNATASSNLSSSIAMFARKQGNGEFIFDNKGNLKQLGLM